MKTNDNSCVCGGCATTGTVLGIIFGVIVGVLFALGFTPLIVTAIWIAFGLAAAVLLYVMVLAVLNSSDGSHGLACCLRKNINCLLAGSIGTIISTMAALAITLLINVIAIVILIAIGTFFFTFMIVSLIYFIHCLVRHSS